MRAVNKATTRRWDRVRTLHARARFVRSWLKIDRTHERVLLDLGRSSVLAAAPPEGANNTFAGYRNYVRLLRTGARVNASLSGAGGVRLNVAARAMERSMASASHALRKAVASAPFPAATSSMALLTFPTTSPMNLTKKSGDR